jgi:hypothetical protein
VNSTPIILRHGNAELCAVPAMHFNHAFAAVVNGICHGPETRPDAIAVELGPRASAEAEKWLRELCAGLNGTGRLPVMLGLMKKNRLIKASLKEKALQMQKDTGRDLSELPAEILRRELGFADSLLLCLSPTDSIIEAIRCGIELNIPVYGVDLDDMADGIYKPVMVQNPEKGESLAGYIDQNAHYTERQRDNEIDHRREVVMAARLKALMEEYHRVVFTCGMAHWRLVRELLDDASIKPSIIPEITAKTEGEFRRIVVHPQIAVKYMDLYPAVSTIYEKTRLSINSSDPAGKRNYPDIAKIFDGLLEKTYRKYFSGEVPRNYRHSNDLDKVGDFEGYLKNLCFLTNRPTPDIFMTVRTAQEMMSSDFARVLSQTFMKYPWASPEDFPDTPILSPSSRESGTVILMKNGYQEGKGFHIRAVSADDRPSEAIIPYEWEKTKEYLKKLGFGITSHTWRPWDYLISALSIKAIESAVKKRIAKKTVAFEGNLLEGLDIKATIRAYSRGDERFYVRDRCKEDCDGLNPLEKFPVVWLFEPGNNNSAEWLTLHEPCSYMEKYVRDRALFERIIRERGSNMVATLAYGSRHIKDRSSFGDSSVRCDRYYGVILFQPIYFTNKQFARYAEMTGYHRRSPFCNDSSIDTEFSDLASDYKRKHGIKVGEYHWSTTMILLALPFAKDVLVVAVPEGYRIEQAVYRKAKKYGVEVCPAPHTLFARTDLDRISLCHLVPAISIDPECIYSKAVEEEIGELQTDNMRLIPNRLLAFGNENYE